MCERTQLARGKGQGPGTQRGPGFGEKTTGFLTVLESTFANICIFIVAIVTVSSGDTCPSGPWQRQTGPQGGLMVNPKLYPDQEGGSRFRTQ